jgi:hypothetical protein
MLIFIYFDFHLKKTGDHQKKYRNWKKIIISDGGN